MADRQQSQRTVNELAAVLESRFGRLGWNCYMLPCQKWVSRIEPGTEGDVYFETIASSQFEALQAAVEWLEREGT